MTWKELKQMVESALDKAGQTEDIEIDYMDFTPSGWGGSPEVYVHEKLDLMKRGTGKWRLTVQ
jgi:hypothetical protein